MKLKLVSLNNNKNNNSDEISTDPPMDGSKEPKDNLKFQPLFCASVDSHLPCR